MTILPPISVSLAMLLFLAVINIVVWFILGVRLYGAQRLFMTF